MTTTWPLVKIAAVRRLVSLLTPKCSFASADRTNLPAMLFSSSKKSTISGGGSCLGDDLVFLLVACWARSPDLLRSVRFGRDVFGVTGDDAAEEGDDDDDEDDDDEEEEGEEREDDGDDDEEGDEREDDGEESEGREEDDDDDDKEGEETEVDDEENEERECDDEESEEGKVDDEESEEREVDDEEPVTLPEGRAFAPRGEGGGGRGAW